MNEDPCICPECGSDEIYYERWAPEHPKGLYACQDCGWTISVDDCKERVIGVKQTGDSDCVAAVAAMATGTSMMEFKKFAGDVFGPYETVELLKYLLNHDYIGGFLMFDNAGKIEENVHDFAVSIPVKGHPAIITVKSERFPDKQHAVYWDGHRVWDPNQEVKTKRSLSSYEITEWMPIYKLQKQEDPS